MEIGLNGGGETEGVRKANTAGGVGQFFRGRGCKRKIFSDNQNNQKNSKAQKIFLKYRRIQKPKGDIKGYGRWPSPGRSSGMDIGRIAQKSKTARNFQGNPTGKFKSQKAIQEDRQGRSNRKRPPGKIGRSPRPGGILGIGSGVMSPREASKFCLGYLGAACPAGKAGIFEKMAGPNAAPLHLAPVRVRRCAVLALYFGRIS